MSDSVAIGPRVDSFSRAASSARHLSFTRPSGIPNTCQSSGMTSCHHNRERNTNPLCRQQHDASVRGILQRSKNLAAPVLKARRRL